jgi:hypothetical protein
MRAPLATAPASGLAAYRATGNGPGEVGYGQGCGMSAAPSGSRWSASPALPPGTWRTRSIWRLARRSLWDLAKADAHGQPIKIGDFSFDDDNFIWVELSPSDYE